MDWELSFGGWVRQRRRALDLTQDALAERIGCARITIQKIEAGERRPSREFAALLAEYLAVPPEQHATFLHAARSELATPQLDNPTRTAANLSARVGAHHASPSPSAGNLPARLTPCIGRERELAQLRSLIADPDCRLITLAGLGGVGKTSLAIEVATVHAAAFHDGAWFVALGDVESSELVVTAIANALGVVRDPAGNPEEQLAFFLRDKQLLLVLDNAEHALSAVAALLARLLRVARGVKAIVTSRERLRLQGEWLIELEGLSYPQAEADDTIDTSGAVQLFLYHARMVRPDFVLGAGERRHVARLCRLLEGLPLAIALAAGWVRLHSCQTLAEQIAQGLDVSALAPRDMPARQRSLLAVFNYSWNLLDEPERAALSRLAVFPGPFDAAAAEAVAGAPLTLLAALLDKSLLRRHGDEHYTLHALVRQYAAERLFAGGEEEHTRAQHAAYFVTKAHTLGVVTAAGDVPLQTLEKLGTIFLDMRAAWEWALARQDTVLVSQLLDYLWAFCLRQSLFGEGLDLFGRAALTFEAAELSANTADGIERRLAYRLRVRQAVYYRQLTLIEQARSLLHRALATAREMGDLPEVALCLEELAGGSFIKGAYRDAQRYYEEALALRVALGDKPSANMNRSMLGLIAHDLGDYVAAQELCQEALDAAEHSGSPRWVIANIALRLSYVEYALGNYRTARTLVEEALAEISDAGRLYSGTVHLRCILGLALAAEGEPVAAEQILRSALGHARAINYPLGIGLALNHLGYVLSRQGAYAEAEELLHEALTLCEAAQNQIGMAYALARLGEVACALGEEARAEQQLLAALQTARAIAAAPLTLDALMGLALVATRRAEYSEALRLMVLPLVHASSRAVTRARAAQLRAELERQLPAGGTAQVLDEVQALGLEGLVDGLLEPPEGQS